MGRENPPTVVLFHRHSFLRGKTTRRIFRYIDMENSIFFIDLFGGLIYDDPEVMLMPLNWQMTLRVPQEWHRRVKAEAALRGVTVSFLVRTAVDYYLELNAKEANTNGKKAKAEE